MSQNRTNKLTNRETDTIIPVMPLDAGEVDPRAHCEAAPPELCERERKRQQCEQLDALAAAMRLPLPSYTG
jgi:hypothetical protein